MKHRQTNALFLVLVTVLLAIGATTASNLAYAQNESESETETEDLHADKTGENIQYLVVLKDKSSITPAQAAVEAKEKGAQVLHVYEHALKGFSIKVPNENVLEDIIRLDPNIDYIERDTTAYIQDQTRPGASSQ